MKNITLFLLIILMLFSCEDTINVDLPTSQPRLVIDASLNWFKNTSGQSQTIKLSLSAPYFNVEIPPANNAIISVSDANSNIFLFEEEGNTGRYHTTTFIPEIDAVYNLTIVYEGETYTATETMKSVTVIDFVEQNDEGGFSGDETEIKAFYTDPVNIKNFYFFEFIDTISVIPGLEVYDDRFNDGNQNFAFFTEEELSIGDQLIIRNYGVSERFYEFMFILLQQSSEDGGGPFETQPATVRGNCINQTNPDRFPFGYFRVSEASEFIYDVQ